MKHVRECDSIIRCYVVVGASPMGFLNRSVTRLCSSIADEHQLTSRELCFFASNGLAKMALADVSH